MRQFLFRVVSRIVSSCLLIWSLYFAVPIALAASLTNLSDTLSDTHVGPAVATHTIAFTTATTSDVKSITFQFSRTAGTNNEPAGMDLTNTTLGTISGVGSSWTLDRTSATSGLLKLAWGGSGTNIIPASTAVGVDIHNVTNSNLGACQGVSFALSDICYVNISTFSDTAYTTQVDSGNTPYIVFEDPTLTLQVLPVAVGVTHNGITTDVTSTSTSLPFGSVRAGMVRYAAQQIRVTTNAPHGYYVYAYLATQITGNYAGGKIDPFGATNVSWTNPLAWTTPTGTHANSNSGWIGANTTDTSVTGWSGTTTGLFGPLTLLPNPVLQSSTPTPTGKSAYVSFALGTSLLQPSDTYTGKIVYDVQATY